MSSIDNQDSQLIVQYLSDFEFNAKMFNGQAMQKIFSDMIDAMNKTKETSDKARLAKQAIEDGNFFGNFWNNRDDALKDAQHNLSLAVANLSENNSRLLMFNVAISKILLDYQQQLNDQQTVLNHQAQELKLHTDELASQNMELNRVNQAIIREQEKLNDLIKEFMEIKGLTNEQVKQLAQVVKDANILKEELVETVKHQYATVSKTIEEMEVLLLGKYNQVQSELSVVDHRFKEVVINIEKSIDDVKDVMANNKQKQEKDVSEVRLLMTSSIEALKDENKQLGLLLGSHQKSLMSDIDALKDDFRSASISTKENHDKLLDRLNTQSKIVAKKEEEIHQSILDVKESLLKNIDVLNADVNDKINNQHETMKSDHVQLKSLLDDYYHNHTTELSHASKNIKKLMESDKVEFENKIFQIQEYLDDEVGKLRKVCWVLSALLVIMIVGFGLIFLNQ